jgi:hypothetical protein
MSPTFPDAVTAVKETLAHVIMWGKGLHQNSRKYDEQRLCQTCWPEAKSVIQGGSGEVVGPLLSHHRCEEMALIVWLSLRSFAMPHCHRRAASLSARPALGKGVEWRCRCGRSTGRGNDWPAMELVTSARTTPLCTARDHPPASSLDFS